MAEWIIKQTKDGTMVAKLIRCKDCGNKKCNGKAGTIVCGITGALHGRLWYCADAKLKEGK